MSKSIRPTAAALERDISRRAKDGSWMLLSFTFFYVFWDAYDWWAAGRRLCQWIGLGYVTVHAIAMMACVGIWVRDKVARRVSLPDKE